MATVGDFVVVHADAFTLPRPDPNTTDLFTSVISFNFQLPPGTQNQGVLATEILTLHKYDDHTDVALQVSEGGAVWNSNYHSAVFLSRVWAVGTAPGLNIVSFEATKFGTIKTEKGEFNGGGAGIFQLANVVVWYKRTA